MVVTLHTRTLTFLHKIYFKCHLMLKKLHKTWKLLITLFCKMPSFWNIFFYLFLLKMDESKKSMKKKYDYLMTKSGISISFPMKVGKMCGCTWVVCDRTRTRTHGTTHRMCACHTHLRNPPFEKYAIKESINLIRVNEVVIRPGYIYLFC